MTTTASAGVTLNDIGSAEDILAAIDKTIKNFNDGDIVEGTIVKVDRDEVLLDIGYKTEGVIPSRELSIKQDIDPSELVQLGDRVEALVLQKEDKEGRPTLPPFDLTGPIGGKNRQADKKSEHHVEDHDPGKRLKERGQGNDNNRQTCGCRAIDPPTESEKHHQPEPGRKRRRKTRGPLGVTKGLKRKRRRLEEKSRLIQIGRPIVGRDQPGARNLHFAGHLRIASLVRRQERKIAQMDEGGPSGQ